MARRCRLVVRGIEVGGRWAPEAANFVRACLSSLGQPPKPLGSCVGAASLLSLPSVR